MLTNDEIENLGYGAADSRPELDNNEANIYWSGFVNGYIKCQSTIRHESISFSVWLYELPKMGAKLYAKRDVNDYIRPHTIEELYSIYLESLKQK